jgi:hypothetical protein
MGSVAERLVGGSATAAKSYFLSRLDPLATGVKKIDFSRNQVWTLGQNLNGWIRHIFLLL